MAFTGTGLIDDLVVTADKPIFSLGTILLLAYGTTGDSETAPWL